MTGGLRCRWLARLTRGRFGLGRWTQVEVDRINATAKTRADLFDDYTD